MKPNLLMIYFEGLPAIRLKFYGGIIETPNFENLIKKSTFYSNVVSSAPSTAMSLTSMFSGLYPHEFGRRNYTDGDSGLPQGITTLFHELEDSGYYTYVLWDEIMDRKGQKFKINVWRGKKTQFFIHYSRFTNPYLKGIFDRKILKRYGKIWLLKEMLGNIKKIKSPWAMMVRIGFELSPDFFGASKHTTNNMWDDEIYEIDHFIKLLLEQYPENTRLILSADHGRMYGEQGIWGYAFNLCEGTLRVPLLDYDPTNSNGKVIDESISLINYKNIILGKELRRTKFLYADTAYADQWHRKTMVRYGRWKYIYHRDEWPCKEQFFDLNSDPYEMINLAVPTYRDPYRDSRPKGDTKDKKFSPSASNVDGKPLREVLTRHDWDEVLKILKELREERRRIWAAQNVFE